MRIDGSFHTAYRDLEERMKTLAEADGNVYLPNLEPLGPVDYVLICMEPSLKGWAQSVKDAKAKVNEGFRNFLAGIEPTLLHLSVRRFLCEGGQSYHITDISKGAMPVTDAVYDRTKRYDRWYPLLLEEIRLVAPNGGIVAVGNKVSQYLKRRGFQRPFTRVIHYSGQAGAARRAGIVGREDSFQAFRDSVSLENVVDTAESVFKEANAPDNFRDETVSLLKRRKLTTSRRQLIFNYKVAFESIRFET